MIHTNTIVRNGSTITLTDEETENIYRYQKRKYQLQDARYHVNDNILLLTDRTDDPWLLNLASISEDDLLEKIHLKRFHKLMNLTEDDLNYIVEIYEDKMDCNADENSIWDLVIDEYLKNVAI